MQLGLRRAQKMIRVKNGLTGGREENECREERERGGRESFLYFALIESRDITASVNYRICC
jgi:hypothetical protein